MSEEQPKVEDVGADQQEQPPVDSVESPEVAPAEESPGLEQD